MPLTESEDFSGYVQGLRSIRRRRWFLWGAILIYVPIIWLSLHLTHSDRATFKVFAAWVLLTAIASGYAALAKCPRCHNYFHLKGALSLFLRRCMHCELHLTSDRKQRMSGR